jgi:hypothetical protein
VWCIFLFVGKAALQFSGFMKRVLINKFFNQVKDKRKDRSKHKEKKHRRKEVSIFVARLCSLYLGTCNKESRNVATGIYVQWKPKWYIQAVSELSFS